MKNTDGTTHPIYINYCLKVKYPLRLFVSYADLLHSSINQELFDKHLCNQSSHYEKYDKFPLRKEVFIHHHQINTLYCQKYELDTKEDTGKSMRNTLWLH